MSQESYNSNVKSAADRTSNDQEFYDRTMPPAQFEQVIEAILEGKYSWACVLILQFSGYNPLHYIPYRTYNRICKDNMPKQAKRQVGRRSTTDKVDDHPTQPNPTNNRLSQSNSSQSNSSQSNPSQSNSTQSNSTVHRLNDEIYPDRCGVNRDLGYVDRLSNQSVQQIKGGMSLWLSCRD